MLAPRSSVFVGKSTHATLVSARRSAGRSVAVHKPLEASAKTGQSHNERSTQINSVEKGCEDILCNEGQVWEMFELQFGSSEACSLEYVHINAFPSDASDTSVALQAPSTEPKQKSMAPGMASLDAITAMFEL